MPNEHELRTFFDNASVEIAAEYRRIYSRSTQDPGTAGDEGESNWAGLLRDWLPSDLHVTTKGRILGVDGSTSPQIDVIVLSPDYPKKLRDKKLYLAGGVVAAFECKNTLKRSDLTKFFQNAQAINAVASPVTIADNYYENAFTPIIYGLLAHSHRLGLKDPAGVIDSTIDRLHQTVDHPRELPDVICISNLFTWVKRYLSAYPSAGPPGSLPWSLDAPDILAGKWRCTTMLMRWQEASKQDRTRSHPAAPNPIGEFVIHTLKRLAISGESSARLVRYYQSALIPSYHASVSDRHWDVRDVYNGYLLSLMTSGQFKEGSDRDVKNSFFLP